MDFDATFLISVFSFVMFVFVMNKIFYTPILEIMKKRQSLVEENFKNAENIKKEIDNKTKYRNEELEKSREEARFMIADNSQKLKKEKSKRIIEYKKEAFENITKEREILKQSAIEAKETLKDNIVDIAKNISENILGADIATDLIDKSKIKE